MTKRILFYAMAIAYVLAGSNHFRNPDMYLKIIPHYLPWHNAINTISGAAEIGLGFLLFFHRTRNAAAWGLVILLVAVFPANIQMAVDYTAQNHPQKWLTYARLPLQPLLIWWAISYTDWYCKRRRTRQSSSFISQG